jgi:hypothetical protein
MPCYLSISFVSAGEDITVGIQHALGTTDACYSLK